MISNGDGTFATPVSYPISSYNGVVIGDFNGDGNSDLATIGTNIYLLLGNGDGTFQSPRSVNRGCGQPAAALVADFNNDGFDDLALDSAILLSNGDGTFRSPICNSIYFPNVVADFNGDGIPDLLTVGSNVYLGKATKRFKNRCFFKRHWIRTAFSAALVMRRSQLQTSMGTARLTSPGRL